VWVGFLKGPIYRHFTSQVTNWNWSLDNLLTGAGDLNTDSFATLISGRQW
jgi:hypothetical protein